MKYYIGYTDDGVWFDDIEYGSLEKAVDKAHEYIRTEKAEENEIYIECINDGIQIAQYDTDGNEIL